MNERMVRLEELVVGLEKQIKELNINSKLTNKNKEIEYEEDSEIEDSSEEEEEEEKEEIIIPPPKSKGRNTKK